jgi:hypothetical protein
MKSSIMTTTRELSIVDEEVAELRLYSPLNKEVLGKLQRLMEASPSAVARSQRTLPVWRHGVRMRLKNITVSQSSIAW